MVQLQLAPNAALRPFLLFRHETVSQLKCFLCSLYQQRTASVTVTVTGRVWTDDGSLADQRVVQPACLLIGPVRLSSFEAQGFARAGEEEGGEDDMDDDEVLFISR
jgi:hypothetical protein